MKDASPAFYSFPSDGKRKNFFVVKIGEAVESYLDACIKCYPHKMEYRAGGFYLECHYYNIRYPLDTLKTGIGSCYPIPINGELKGKEIILKSKNYERHINIFRRLHGSV